MPFWVVYFWVILDQIFDFVPLRHKLLILFRPTTLFPPFLARVGIRDDTPLLRNDRADNPIDWAAIVKFLFRYLSSLEPGVDAVARRLELLWLLC